jgi:hypothetical protein
MLQRRRLANGRPRWATVSSPKSVKALTRIWSEQTAVTGGADAGFSLAAQLSRVSRLALSPNTVCCSYTLITCRQTARICCENYGKIILKRGIHRFNYESFQTLADTRCPHRSDIILMICDDGLNRGSFLLGCHAGTFNFCSLSAIKNERRPRYDEHHAATSSPCIAYVKLDACSKPRGVCKLSHDKWK